VFGVVCPFYIHAHILRPLHVGTVEVAPYRSEKEEGNGCFLVWFLFRPEWNLCVLLRVVFFFVRAPMKRSHTTSMTSFGGPRSYMILSSLSWSVVLNAKVKSTKSVDMSCLESLASSRAVFDECSLIALGSLLVRYLSLNCTQQSYSASD